MDSVAKSEVTLMLPTDDYGNPELSIVVPALNEEITIGRFVDWCKEGIAGAGVAAEILIVDSSTDRTAEIAVEHGARVLKTPKRGLGRAYIDAIPHIRGCYVLMGDADCTYDFRELGGFVEKFRDGYEFIMGSRFAGSIEDGAMPPLHRYFGTPLTSCILNFIYRTKFGDIHCGMRGLTKETLVQLGLTSQGWEYASEIIVKACQLKLKTAEVPVRFFKDQKGRRSHVKRSGWLTPWRAGWHTLKIILIYGSQRVIRPVSTTLSLLAFLTLFLLAGGPITAFGMTLTLHTMFLASTILIMGLVLEGISVLSICINDRLGNDLEYWAEKFQFTRSMAISLSLFLSGLALCGVFLARYISSNFVVDRSSAWISHLSALGLTMMVVAVLLAAFVIILQALVDRLRVADDI